jgi:hypothetical protein
MSSESANPSANQKGEKPLADELGIEDLSDSVFCARGRLFSAAGRESPVAEITETHLLLYPPDKPFDENGHTEDIAIRVNEDGILINDFGELRVITGARYYNRKLYCMGKKGERSGKHLVCWFDDNAKPHTLFYQGTELTTGNAFRLRNSTHDGEISIWADLTSDDAES